MKISLQKQQEINEIKSRLITTMSHEFRTPLAVISSSASILRDFSRQLSEEKKQKHLETIETYVQHTTQLLEDVLVLNRVNAGQLSFKPQRINLVNFFSDLVNELHLMYGDHSIHLHIIPMTFSLNPPSLLVPDSSSSLPTFLTSDQERVKRDPGDFDGNPEGDIDIKLLRQIILNLIENSVKYSIDEIRIQLTLKLTIDQIIFEIQDWGIGILPEDQHKLFEPFHRGQNVGQRSGTGLGLSVVKSCVDLHQGQIDIQSQPGQGTIFSVTLPRYSVV